MIQALYEKDTKETYQVLLELEKLSEENNSLYHHTDEFFEMIHSEKYVMRVRGYRLLCKQAKWDTENKFANMIDKILLEVEDEKQTAIRQKLKALEDVAKHKKELHQKIKQKITSIDCSKYRETMQSLIEKDIKNLLAIIDKKKKEIHNYDS
jgi:thioester reductase-like protein